MPRALDIYLVIIGQSLPVLTDARFPLQIAFTEWTAFMGTPVCDCVVLTVLKKTAISFSLK